LTIKIVDEDKGRAYESPLWMVQVNLGGIHSPRKMSYRSDDGFYSDKSGEYCSDTGEDSEEDGLVRWFFSTDYQAKTFYDRLSQYRKFLKRYI
jgi:hypothetical protein